MSDNAKFAPTPAHAMSAPDITVNARDVFGIDVDMTVPALVRDLIMCPRLTRTISSTRTPLSPFWQVLAITGG